MTTRHGPVVCADSHCVRHSDREYPRLGQMIVDYENPLKKMMEEFVPHGKVGELCLCSFIRVNIS